MSFLINKSWSASPHWYDYDNRIDFKNNIMELAGGQWVHMFCGITYTIIVDNFNNGEKNMIESGTIKFVYDTIKNQMTDTFECSPEFPSDGYDKQLLVSYKIYRGQYDFKGPYNEFKFKHKLVFNKCPIPPPYAISLFLMIHGKEIHNQKEYYY